MLQGGRARVPLAFCCNLECGMERDVALMIDGSAPP